MMTRKTYGRINIDRKWERDVCGKREEAQCACEMINQVKPEEMGER